MTTEENAAPAEEAAPEVGTPEYNAQMAEKAGATPEELAALKGEEPPELIAGKYKTNEDLEQGILHKLKQVHGDDLAGYYKSLESGESPPEETATESTAETPEGEQSAENGELNWEKYGQEFFQDGKLSEASRQELAKQMPEDLIDSYFEGMQAKAQLAAQELFNTAGGEESYNAMVDWASDNYEDAEIDAFNNLLESGDLATQQLAVAGLKARYVAANGEAPSERLHGQQTAAAGDVYKSRAEVTRDMGDARYQKDPAFRQQVMDRIARSNVL